MARLRCLLLRLFPLLCLISPTLQSVRYGFPPDALHVDMQDERQSSTGKLIDSVYGFEELIRTKRNVKILPGAGDGAAASLAAAAAATAAATDVKKTDSPTTSSPKPFANDKSSHSFGASDSMQNAKNIATMVRTSTALHRPLSSFPFQRKSNLLHFVRAIGAQTSTTHEFISSKHSKW